MTQVRRSRGFSLAELMVTVAIVGVLAALATFGLGKYMRHAKTGEALNSIGRLRDAATIAYHREGMAAELLPLGASTGYTHRFCGSADNPVPISVGSLRGRKYQSSPTEWSTGSQFTGWTCLNFSMSAPQYYQYSYASENPVGAIGEKFDILAHGDLDGDGTTSTFRMQGLLQIGTVATPVVTTSPVIEQIDSLE